MLGHNSDMPGTVICVIYNCSSHIILKILLSLNLNCWDNVCAHWAHTLSQQFKFKGTAQPPNSHLQLEERERKHLRRAKWLYKLIHSFSVFTTSIYFISLVKQVSQQGQSTAVCIRYLILAMLGSQGRRAGRPRLNSCSCIHVMMLGTYISTFSLLLLSSSFSSGYFSPKRGCPFFLLFWSERSACGNGANLDRPLFQFPFLGI